jgi:hypothetical protein
MCGQEKGVVMASLALVLEGTLRNLKNPNGSFQDRYGGMTFPLNVTLRQHDSKHFYLDFEVPTGKYEFTTTEYNEETDEEVNVVLTLDVSETLTKGLVRPMGYVMPSSFEVEGNIITLLFEE